MRNFSPESKANLGSKTKELWKDPEYRKRMSDAHKGQIAWNKGRKIATNTGRTRFKKGQLGTWSQKPMSKEHKEKLLAANHAKKGKKVLKNRGENNYRWKGYKASYSALHGWVRRTFGKADKCENTDCYYPRLGANGKILQGPKAFDWSNKSGKYLHDRNDWVMLCRSCHIIYDRTNHVSIPHNWENRVNENINE